MKLYDELERISGLTKASAIREWKRVVKDTLGVDLYADYYTGDFFKQAIDRWVEDNVSYIKSVPEETLGEMKDVILDGYEQGKTYTSIVSDIQDRYNVSKSKAKFLARDQISTLNAQITKSSRPMPAATPTSGARPRTRVYGTATHHWMARNSAGMIRLRCGI